VWDDKTSLPHEEGPYRPGGFGWDDFTLVSKESKSLYMATQLFNSFCLHIPEVEAKRLVHSHLGVTIGNAYVDHQSCIAFPVKKEKFRNLYFVDMDFFYDVYNYIVDNDSVIILGGNDNEDKHPLRNGGQSILSELGRDRRRSKNVVCRKDYKYDYWTIFNKDTGKRTRLSFIDGVKADKAYAPELVDLKITDYCDHRCKFCYQNSSKSGTHANIYSLTNLIYRLSNLNVFEIAFGGGEPTSHPEFDQILGQCRVCGIVPNFSTKNLDWLHKDIKREEILDCIGAFAFSTNDINEVTDLVNILDKYKVPKHKATIQTIPALFDDVQQLRTFMETCAKHRITATYLGYKDCGRGIEFKDKLQNGENLERALIPTCSKIRKEGKYFPRISVDTALASKCQDQLDEYGIPEYCYSVKEGKFSMYIDAVRMEMGPSSFCSKDEMVPFTKEERDNLHNDQIVRNFANW
jgi:hypothetical protein